MYKKIPTHHNEIDQTDGIEGNPPPVHHPPQVHQNHENRRQDNHRSHEIEPREDKNHDENGRQGDCHGFYRVAPHCQILLVKNVENRVGKYFVWPVGSVVVQHSGYVGGDEAGRGEGGGVVLWIYDSFLLVSMAMGVFKICMATLIKYFHGNK